MCFHQVLGSNLMNACINVSYINAINEHVHPLVEINQDVTSPFMTKCDLQSFATRFGNICKYKTKFQLFFIILTTMMQLLENFILLAGSILHLFSSINRLICPINCNKYQISCILKIFYNVIRVCLYVCNKIINIQYAYVCILFI